MKKFTLFAEITLNAPDIGTAMQMVYDGIRSTSDDAEVYYTDGSEVFACTAATSKFYRLTASAHEDCQICDCSGAEHEAHA